MQFALNPADWAVDLLECFKTNYVSYPWSNLCRNTNLRALSLLKNAKEKDYNWCYLGANPSAINLIEKKWEEKGFNRTLIHCQDLIKNPAGEGIIYKLFPYVNLVNEKYGYVNPAPWPKLSEILRANYNVNYDLTCICSMHGAQWAIDILLANKNWNYVDIKKLCINKNPAILAMLRDNAATMPLHPSIWSNPGIFELTVPNGLRDALKSLIF